VSSQERASFCEQKEAKKLVKLGRAGFTATGPAWPEVFAPLFSKSGYFLSLKTT
jgi:hypothetical protein